MCPWLELVCHLPYGIGTWAAFAPMTVFHEWFPVWKGQTFIIGACSGNSSLRSLENRWAKPWRSVFPPKNLNQIILENKKKTNWH